MMAKLKVAIPIHGDSVAPCFEVARRFLFGEIEDRKVLARTVVSCASCETYKRVQLLQLHSVHVLLCNGINRTYRNMLEGSGIRVIANISQAPDSALRRFARGEIALDTDIPLCASPPVQIPLEALICWARDLFEGHGYNVSDGPGGDSYLIDLVAIKSCPVCGRVVRIAICCGAHTYSIDKEIQEFYRLSMHDYSARVLVIPSDSSIVSRCREYGIEVIDPDAVDAETAPPAAAAFPLLRHPVAGHEKVYATPGAQLRPDQNSDEVIH